jgi:hypothetical protein
MIDLSLSIFIQILTLAVGVGISWGVLRGKTSQTEDDIKKLDKSFSDKLAMMQTRFVEKMTEMQGQLNQESACNRLVETRLARIEVDLQWLRRAAEKRERDSDG